MQKVVFDIKQFSLAISEYSYTSHTHLMRCRCSDDMSLVNNEIPLVSIPGGDIGELALLMATSAAFGFEVKMDKAIDVLQTILKDPIHGHDDNAHCLYLQTLKRDPKLFSLEASDIALLEKYIPATKPTSHTSVFSAVIQVKGEWSIKPQITIENEGKHIPVHLLLFQQTMIDRRHKQFAKALVESHAVTLYNDLDEEYLYEVLSSETEDHFLETARQVAAGAPMYEVKFADDGSFELEDLGGI